LGWQRWRQWPRRQRPRRRWQPRAGAAATAAGAAPRACPRRRRRPGWRLRDGAWGARRAGERRQGDDVWRTAWGTGSGGGSGDTPRVHGGHARPAASEGDEPAAEPGVGQLPLRLDGRDGGKDGRGHHDLLPSGRRRRCISMSIKCKCSENTLHFTLYSLYLAGEPDPLGMGKQGRDPSPSPRLGGRGVALALGWGKSGAGTPRPRPG